MFWAMIVGISVDLDVFVSTYFGILPYQHHRFIVHTPFFWAMTFFAFYIIIRRVSKHRAYLIVPFAAAVASHLILDSFAEGLPWAFPLDGRLYGLGLPFPSIEPLNTWVIHYISTPLAMLLELSIVAYAIYLMIKTKDMKFFLKFAKRKKLKDKVYYLFNR